jgi:hypothetical protein
MTYAERKQIEYLKQRKNNLIDEFIGACNEINNQIKEVKSGEWAKEVADKE